MPSEPDRSRGAVAVVPIAEGRVRDGRPISKEPVEVVTGAFKGMSPRTVAATKCAPNPKPGSATKPLRSRPALFPSLAKIG
ncbi:MAG: hypothetical protein ACJA1L_001370 [Paracoccaceae bacterium]|jgi:hypothetical protein